MRTYTIGKGAAGGAEEGAGGAIAHPLPPGGGGAGQQGGVTGRGGAPRLEVGVRCRQLEVGCAWWRCRAPGGNRPLGCRRGRKGWQGRRGGRGGRGVRGSPPRASRRTTNKQPWMEFFQDSYLCQDSLLLPLGGIGGVVGVAREVHTVGGEVHRTVLHLGEGAVGGG